MREFDELALEVAIFQARFFEESVDKFEGSSPIFLRRFYLSRYAVMLDDTDPAIVSLDTVEGFYELNKQHGESKYGKIKYSKNGLYWLGYFSRYVCYTRNISSRMFYRLFDVKDVYSLYEAYHTQSEEWCLEHLLKMNGYTEADLDINERLKRALRRSMNLNP